MLRHVANPPNPYLSEHCDWLGEPPAVRVQVYEETAKSIISTNDSPDIGFDRSINPYRGCQHACAYCYARPTHEYLGFGAGTDFESRITVKINAPELLTRELGRSRKRGSLVFSGVTDCYQPLEASYRLTRRCLEVCRDFDTPVGIVTKSFLVVRDAELLADLHQRCGAAVYVSIPFADRQTAWAIEPGAPPPARRFEAIRRLHEAGVPVNVMVAPIIPGLNDRDIPTVLERAAEAGASSAYHTILRLPGNVAEIFLSRLQQTLPDRAKRIEARIRDMRGGELNDSRFGRRFKGEGEYWSTIQKMFRQTVKRLGLNARTATEETQPRPEPPTSHQLPLFGEPQSPTQAKRISRRQSSRPC